MSSVIINAVKFGADPTGQQDSTEAIQRALKAAAVFGVDMTLPTGTYRVSAPLDATGTKITNAPA